MLSDHNKYSRRDFIIRSTQAAAGVVLLNQFTGCTKPGAEMRLGLVTYLWGQDWDLDTLIKNCETAKLLGVELRTTHAHGVEPSLTPEQRAAVKARFADTPVELVGIGSNENYDSPDPEKLKMSIEATKAFIKLSHDVGGSGVKVKPNSFHEGVPHEVTIEQIGKSLNTLGAFGADYNQQIRLENDLICHYVRSETTGNHTECHARRISSYRAEKTHNQSLRKKHPQNLTRPEAECAQNSYFLPSFPDICEHQ